MAIYCEMCTKSTRFRLSVQCVCAIHEWCFVVRDCIPMSSHTRTPGQVDPSNQHANILEKTFPVPFPMTVLLAVWWAQGWSVQFTFVAVSKKHCPLTVPVGQSGLTHHANPTFLEKFFGISQISARKTPPMHGLRKNFHASKVGLRRKLGEN